MVSLRIALMVLSTSTGARSLLLCGDFTRGIVLQNRRGGELHMDELSTRFAAEVARRQSVQRLPCPTVAWRASAQWRCRHLEEARPQA